MVLSVCKRFTNKRITRRSFSGTPLAVLLPLKARFILHPNANAKRNFDAQCQSLHHEFANLNTFQHARIWPQKIHDVKFASRSHSREVWTGPNTIVFFLLCIAKWSSPGPKPVRDGSMGKDGPDYTPPTRPWPLLAVSFSCLCSKSQESSVGHALL